jgi:hypothetical protein
MSHISHALVKKNATVVLLIHYQFDIVKRIISSATALAEQEKGRKRFFIWISPSLWANQALFLKINKKAFRGSIAVLPHVLRPVQIFEQYIQNTSVVRK